MREAAQLRQRADYTYSFNTKTGRHGWLRLTPAYSVKVVEEIISGYGEGLNVLDPFCGTGTTALCAVSRGHRATTVDINPFLVWLARIKTGAYSQTSLAKTKRAGLEALDAVRREAVAPAPVPNIHRIERWWPEPARCFLAHLKAAILASAVDGEVRDLLHIAFCRTLIKLSNAAFNHQSMSFKDSDGAQGKLQIELDANALFLDDLQFVLRGACHRPNGVATVVQDDARDLSRISEGRFDLVVTSPPYANRMSYIRELRPYMYWLGYLKDASDAGELDWKAIGGTWGIATSRLGAWSRQRDHRLPKGVDEIVGRIASQANANSGLLAAYVAKYCEDMARHFHCLRSVLKKGARVHYIVGNSTFYGVLVPTEQIYAAMLQECGLVDVTVRPIRKRNSKKALVEFDVSAAWPGGLPSSVRLSGTPPTTRRWR